MVNVKVVEKSVNSHVGSVMVEKVISQYRNPGITRKTARIIQPSNPKVDICAGSVAFSEAVLFANSSEELAADVIASAGVMVVGIGGFSTCEYLKAGPLPDDQDSVRVRRAKAAA